VFQRIQEVNKPTRSSPGGLDQKRGLILRLRKRRSERGARKALFYEFSKESNTFVGFYLTLDRNDNRVMSNIEITAEIGRVRIDRRFRPYPTMAHMSKERKKFGLQIFGEALRSLVQKKCNRLKASGVDDFEKTGLDLIQLSKTA
jgi:hypothetical protein